MDRSVASPRRGIGRRRVLVLGLGLALAGCFPPPAPPATPAASESPLPASTAIQPTQPPSAAPSPPAPTATPDQYLLTVAHISPAERTDDQTAADADWPIAVGSESASPTPVTRVVDQTVTHVVTKGETLSSIAARNGLTADAIARANGLGVTDVIYVGQRLAIPTGKKVTVTESSQRAQTLEPHFMWPARAPITTYFNEKGSMWKGGFHSGLDIGALYGDPIVAAESGVVLEAGWATTRGYGNYVKIDHGLGYTTLYGHMSVIRATVGQWVNRGDRIGDVGSTGVSTGPHLHFEMRIDDQPVDPLPYLPT